MGGVLARGLAIANRFASRRGKRPLPTRPLLLCLEIVDVARVPSGQYVNLLSSEPGKTGWPPFLVLHTDAAKPDNVDGCVEVWLGTDSSDVAHFDYWRASKQEQLFLIRGFQEDTTGFPNSSAPGTVFGLTLPVWRVAECLFMAAT